MRRLHRYWKVWRESTPDERDARFGRVVERWLRRSPRVRRLGLLADEPRWGRLARALDCDLRDLPARMRRDDSARGPLHGALDARAAAVATRHPDHSRRILAQTAEMLEGRYDLLGSGPVRLAGPDGRIDWHRDWRRGARWPAELHHTEQVTVRGDGSDVKLPWELSRFQHFVALGQAWRLAPHLDPAGAVGLRSRIAGTFRNQLTDWIAANPRGIGIHWTCTMEVALRAASWCAGLALLRPAAELDDGFLLRLARALWLHGLHIRRNLERQPGRPPTNHYVADLAGLLAVACALPELRAARRWRSFAWGELQEQIERQVHPDGVDFERSLPYHRLVAEMFVHAGLLAGGAGDNVPGSYRRRLAAMAEFVAACTRPDGTVAQWGDGDDGRFLPLDGYASPTPHDHRHVLDLCGAWLGDDALRGAAAGQDVETLWLLGSEGGGTPSWTSPRTSRAFADGACYVLCGDDLHALVACGPVGTNGLGNHSHNDLFAPSLWAAGVEWITDPGTGVYSADPHLRNALRSTAAHATLQLGTREQNELGSGIDGLFRCTAAARPEVRSWSADARGARLCARHHGFAGWIHEREIELDVGARLWRIRDMLSRVSAPSTDESVFLRFPLAPLVQAERYRAFADWPAALAAHAADWLGGERQEAWLLALAGRQLWLALGLPATATSELSQAPFSPRYGVVLSAGVIVATMPAADALAVRALVWSPAGSP